MKKIYLLVYLINHISIAAFATILNVPGSFSSIQSAINASSNTDTILVEPGIYFENLNLRGKKIVLTSRFYAQKDTTFICSTIINGSQPLYPDTASCIIINTGEDSTTVVQGFTITGGAGTKWTDEHGAGNYREGGGILTAFTSPIIRNNFIVSNWVTNTTAVSSTGGGAMRCGDGTPKIYNNVIANNKARYGGGIVFNYCDSALLKNNLIFYNSGGQSYGGAGVWANGNGVVFIENNTIAFNHATGSGTYGGKGGGICALSTIVYSKNNIVWGNTQSAGNSIRNFGGTLTATYSDIDFTFTGIGNINVNPNFSDTLSCRLALNSSCIDAGDTVALCNDNNSSSTTALFPSYGTARNDMGAYGGKLSSVLPICALTALGKSEIRTEYNLRIYPNPAKDYLQIDSPYKNIRGIQIKTILGTELLSVTCNQNPIRISTSHFSSGLYLIFLKFDDQTVSTKFQIY